MHTINIISLISSKDLDKIIQILDAKKYNDVCISFSKNIFDEDEVKYIRNKIDYASCFSEGEDYYYLELYR